MMMLRRFTAIYGKFTGDDDDKPWSLGASGCKTLICDMAHGPPRSEPDLHVAGSPPNTSSLGPSKYVATKILCMSLCLPTVCSFFHCNSITWCRRTFRYKTAIRGQKRWPQYPTQKPSVFFHHLHPAFTFFLHSGKFRVQPERAKAELVDGLLKNMGHACEPMSTHLFPTNRNDCDHLPRAPCKLPRVFSSFQSWPWIAMDDLLEHLWEDLWSF